jgi:hypothetical protein
LPSSKYVEPIASSSLNFSSYHLVKTRPALQRPPLADLLPKGYLSALRRTDGRVRFQGGDGKLENHMDLDRATARSAISKPSTPRPKQQSPLRAKSRSISRQRKVRIARNSSSNEDFKAESRHSVSDVDGKEQEVVSSQQSNDVSPESADFEHIGMPSEMSRQVKQLNVPLGTPEVISGMVHSGDMLRLQEPCAEQDEKSERGAERASALNAGDLTPPALRRVPSPSIQDGRPRGRTTMSRSRQESTRYASALSNPFPPNLPLSIIRLIESYVNQFVASEAWTAGQGEKGYLLVSPGKAWRYSILILLVRPER